MSRFCMNMVASLEGGLKSIVIYYLYYSVYSFQYMNYSVFVDLGNLCLWKSLSWDFLLDMYILGAKLQSENKIKKISVKEKHT
jgi:hypothetical protein